jgi:hypothetical protein
MIDIVASNVQLAEVKGLGLERSEITLYLIEKELREYIGNLR